MQHATPIFAIGLLILFGMYRRARRTIGFQKLDKGRIVTRLALLTVVGIAILVTGYLHPLAYAFDAMGIVLGDILAYYAIRTTSFEWRKNAWFYRPNPWIGVLLLVLFVGRIAYRVYEGYALIGRSAVVHGNATGQPQWTTYSHDPLTAVILFTLITYHVVYYTFLIRKERHLEKGEQRSNV